MELLHAWLLFPLIAAVTSLGIGLLIERTTADRLSGVLLVPLGLTGLICISQLTTLIASVAPYTPFVVVGAALAGFVMGGRRLVATAAIDRGALLMALAVFALHAAPIVLSGSPTIAGYGIDNATAVHLIGADALLSFGAPKPDLPASTYSLVLTDYYFGTGYPSGTHTALGSLTRLAVIEPAWAFAPMLALFVTAMALALYQLARRVIELRWLLALAVFVAAQATLFYRYALNGSLKEIGALFTIVLTAALLPFSVERLKEPRAMLPLAVSLAATLAVIGPTAALWLVPLAVLWLAWVVVRLRPSFKSLATAGGSLAIPVVILALPTVLDLSRLSRAAVAVGGTVNIDLGYLFDYLPNELVFGSWFRDDFRDPTQAEKLIWLLGGLVVISAIAYLLRRRSWRFPELLFCCLASLSAWLVVLVSGSAWGHAKATAMFTPILLIWSFAGLAALWTTWQRRLILRGGVALVLVGLTVAVVLSNAIAYHGVNLAPRDRFKELERLGDRITDRGPTVIADFEEYAKYFLRDADPEAIAEGIQSHHRRSGFPDTARPPLGLGIDLDLVSSDYLEDFRLIVLRRGPNFSRPPASFTLAYRGRYYELWERTTGARVVKHLALGDSSPAAVGTAEASCEKVKQLVSDARPDTELAYVGGPGAAAASQPASYPPPNGWHGDKTEPYTVHSTGAGSIDSETVVPKSVTYRLWLMGSFSRRNLSVLVDDHPVGVVFDRLNPRGQYELVGEVKLRKGRHRISLRRDGGGLEPGSGGSFRLIGTVILTTGERPSRVSYLPLERYRELCGREFDWVELVRRQRSKSAN